MRWLTENDITSINRAVALIEDRDAALDDMTCAEIKRYNEKARRVLAPWVVDKVAQFRPKGPLTLFRGLGIKKSEAAAFLKKMKAKPVEGAKGKYKTGKRQSWTGNQNQAEEFAGLFSIAGRDPDSLGIIIKANVKPEQIALPLGNMPKDLLKQCAWFDQDEYVLEPVDLDVEIVKLIGDWTAVADVNLKKIIQTAGEKIVAKHGGEIKKTWNKQSGFAWNLTAYSPADHKDWAPSFEVAVDEDFTVRLGLMGPKPPPVFGQKVGTMSQPYPHKNVGELVKFLQDDLVDLLSAAFEDAKPWFEGVRDRTITHGFGSRR